MSLTPAQHITALRNGNRRLRLENKQLFATVDTLRAWEAEAAKQDATLARVVAERDDARLLIVQQRDAVASALARANTAEAELAPLKEKLLKAEGHYALLATVVIALTKK